MKTKNAVVWLTLLALMLLSACSTTTPSATPVAVSTQGMPSSEGIQTYHGEGFSLQYPTNARIENRNTDPAATSEVHIVGPEVCVKPCDADWLSSGPAYEFIVQTYSNPDDLDAESWARNYILTSWQQAQERGEPLMGPPVSENGEILEQQVGNSIVAGYSAFWANFLAGDSYRRTFFLSNDQQVIALSFYDYPLANQPLAMVQQDVYALIMGTFRFEGE